MSVSNPTDKERGLLARAKNWWESISLQQKRQYCLEYFGSPDFLELSDYNIFTIYGRTR